ncbi:dTDP-4-dehydrorhamnose 3,5-epimerase [Enterobacteriaceae bacterium C34A]
MNILDTKIDGVKIIEPRVFEDPRGFFLETFNEQKYQDIIGNDLKFVQDNHSRSVKNVLRGLHLQKNNPQGKLVRVVRGEVLDVAVDVRKGSPTFGEWQSVILSESNKRQFWIPPGLAHGFVVLSDIVDFEYKCTHYYDPQSERCILWSDSDLNIDWQVKNPLLSDKDQKGLTFKEYISQL